MRSSDLFTTIAEKSRPTATTHSRDRERNLAEPSSECEPDPSSGRRTAPTSPPGRVTSLVSWLVGPVPACRSDYLYRLPVLERRRGFALSPGTAYRDPTRRPTRSPGAGSGLIREFEGRGHADPGDRERDTRATRLTVISRSHPKVGHSKHCRARGPRGPRWAWLPRGHAQFAESAAASVIYSISNVIQYKFRLHRVHARRVIATAAIRGSTIPRDSKTDTPQRHHRFAH
jgi:hypothetical protein